MFFFKLRFGWALQPTSFPWVRSCTVHSCVQIWRSLILEHHYFSVIDRDDILDLKPE